MIDSWKQDFETIAQNYSHLPNFGFRASCVRNWALQYDFKQSSRNTAQKPSRRILAPILASVGYSVGNKFIRNLTERIYFKGCEKASQVSTLLIFINSAWIAEGDLEAQGLSQEYIWNPRHREREARTWASGAQHRAAKAALDNEKELHEAERAAYRIAEQAAAESINEALANQRDGLGKRYSDEFPRALGRWRRAFRRGITLTGEEAIKPEKRVEKAQEKISIKRIERLNKADRERGGSDFGWRWR